MREFAGSLKLLYKTVFILALSAQVIGKSKLELSQLSVSGVKLGQSLPAAEAKLKARGYITVDRHERSGSVELALRRSKGESRVLLVDASDALVTHVRGLPLEYKGQEYSARTTEAQLVSLLGQPERLQTLKGGSRRLVYTELRGNSGTVLEATVLNGCLDSVDLAVAMR